MPKTSAEKLADKMYEQWVNGNRKYVMNHFSNMGSIESGCVGARLVWKMMRGDIRDIKILIHMMEERMDYKYKRGPDA